MNANRCLRSTRARNRLWYAANGICPGCLAPLPAADWHADHVVPWRLTHTTNQHEMQALCARCNLIKGGKFVQFDSDFLNALRPFQRRFLLACSTMLNHGKRRIMALVTPGAGKQTLAYLAQMGIDPSICDAYAFVTPRVNLRNQGELIPPFLSDLCADRGWTLPEYRAADNIPDPRRGCPGYVTTVQSIVSDPGFHAAEFRRARYCLILDECQLLSEEGGNAWVKAVQPLVDAAQVVILMSGGAYRHDRQRVAFLPYTLVDGKEVIDTNAPEFITIPYTRGEAIQDGAILPVEFHRHDMKGVYLDRAGKQIAFDSFGDRAFDDRALRDQIRVAVQGDAAEKLIDGLLSKWQTARREHPDCQAIVVVESQANAKRQAKRIEALYPGCPVGLAITDDSNAHDTVRQFCRGQISILVTVGMAYIGMDSPRASHMALCCVVRSRPYIEQAIARVVRRYGKQTRAVVETFDDDLMDDVVQRIEQEQQEAVYQSGAGIGTVGRMLPTGFPTGIQTELTGMRAHEPNRINLTPEMSQYYATVAAKHGLALTPVQVHDLFNDMHGLGVAPVQPGRTAPNVGRREVEDKLKAAIERQCRSNDARRGWAWGDTGRALIAHFGKRREEMSIPELQQVMVWVTQFSAEAA